MRLMQAKRTAVCRVVTDAGGGYAYTKSGGSESRTYR